MIPKIAIVGPESSGKSTLSAALAQQYQTVWVREYAREYLKRLGRPYQMEDLTEIAKGQLQLEIQAFPDAHRVLICDTNLLVVKVWSEYKYGQLAPWIAEHLGLKHYAWHLLCYPDLPWEDDPLREHPNPEQREELFAIYESALIEAQVPYTRIEGTHEARLRQSEAIINALFP